MSLCPVVGLHQHIKSTLGISLPTDEDVDGSIEGLLRLQETYRLSCGEMFGGLVAGVTASRQLGCHDMLMLGQAALKKGNSERAVEWLEIAIRDTSWTADERVHVLSELARAYHMVNYNHLLKLPPRDS